MLKQQVNIRSFQKNLPELIDLVINGEEIIITKSDIPIAKVVSIDNNDLAVKHGFLTARVIETTKRAISNEASENWFG